MKPFSHIISIVIADDHKIFREGFKILLEDYREFKLAGEASDGDELIKLVRAIKPDIVIIDVMMPKMDGICATKKIAEEFPDTGVIILSTFEEENIIYDAIEAGAKTYLLKTANNNDIVNAIMNVYKKEPFYYNGIGEKNKNLHLGGIIKNDRKKKKSEFSEKEITIIKFICDGFSCREIGLKLYLSERTVEDYRQRIMVKMDAKNTAGIVVFAIKNKIYSYAK